jgi:hypothetical protein
MHGELQKKNSSTPISRRKSLIKMTLTEAKTYLCRREREGLSTRIGSY